MNSQFSLLTTRRFLPLFIVQFIGAFIDNLLKSMVAVMVAYGLWETHGVNPAVLVSLAAALFILPFALFCHAYCGLGKQTQGGYAIRAALSK
jgi:ABC-type glycerol-3-phosphate transport system permease component